MAISTSVGTERRSRVSGYGLGKGNFQEDTPYLPQRIVILGEANTANQSGLSTTKKQITSAKEAAETYGYGSPIHSMMRILRPINSTGVGGIPTIVMPQISDVGATATTREWTVTGTATGNATHYVVVNGRDTLDFQSYGFSVATGDTATVIGGKAADAISKVIGAPVKAANVAGVVTFTSKWEGATSAEINISFSVGDTSVGVSYSETDSTDGAGTVDISDALAQFGNDWNTIVLNPYGSTLFSTLEDFNGIPGITGATGRYVGIVFKPFVAFTGSVLTDKDDYIAITDASARIEEVTNALCPAPGSLGFTWEAAANYARLFARVAQDTPHLDVNNMSLPDMPVPSDEIIGDMADYENRDALVKAGCSTVVLENGAYKIQDFVTMYHPDGEYPLQYAYVRNLMLDFNIAYQYQILEERFVKDRALLLDGQFSSVKGTIKPKEWKSILFDFFADLSSKALIVDASFSEESLQVGISTVNPDRFETLFRYKRSGIARIESTDVEAGFNN